MPKARLPFLLCLLLAAPAFAAEVIGVASNRKNIAVNHENIGRWAVDDRVCVLQANVDVVCGTVTKATEKGAIVKLDTVFEGVAIGDLVRKAGSGRKIANESREQVEMSRDPKRFDATLGFIPHAAFDFMMLSLDFQIALSSQFALGLYGSFTKNSASTLVSVQGIGALATVNYYGSSSFRGLWVQGGVGMTFESATVTTTAGPTSGSGAGLSLLGSVGYRARFGPGLNVGVAGGVLFVSEVTDVTATGISPSFEGVHPIFLVDFGVNF